MSYKELHSILADMLRATGARNEGALEELNNKYEAVARETYKEPTTKIDLDFDLCRTLCMTALRYNSEHVRYMKQAREAFDKLGAHT